jgi:methylated-DNA-[protein]-cysteine S-methyltransferase
MTRQPGDETHFTYFDSPIGRLLLVGQAGFLKGILFPGEHEPYPLDPGWRRDQESLRPAVEQLQAYFRGELRQFDLPLAPQGTPFQQKVWEALRAIPFGKTISYSELAERAGAPGAVRAVGAANGRNPIPIVIPCHRVIGKDGSLTGYGGGLPIKSFLLDHEAQALLLRKSVKRGG